jgi:membrane protease YdiL (CAAX protease family)
MTWRQALADWKDLDQRRPPGWWLGLTGTLAGAIALAALEARRMAPRGPVRGVLLALLLVVLVIVGRRLFWNDAERRLRLPWRLAGFLAIIALLNAVVTATGLRPPSRAALTGSAPFLRVSAIALVMMLTACVLAVRLLDRRPVRQLGIVPGPRFWGDLAFGLFLGAALMTLIFGVEWAVGWIRVDRVRYTRDAAEPFTGAFLRMLGVFVGVGIYEELVSRGYLLRTMAQGFAGRRIGPVVALAIGVLVSSLLFGLGHANNPNASVVSTVNIVIAGIVLALPYVLTGRLAASIGFHVTWNFFQSTVYGFPTSGFASPASALLVAQGGPENWTGGAFGPEAGILGLVALALAAGAVLVRERLRHGRIAVCTALVTGTEGEGAPGVTAATTEAPSAPAETPAS